VGVQGYQKVFLSLMLCSKNGLVPISLGSWYLASALMWNFRVALYGSPTSLYFDVEPPILSQYLGLLGTAAQESH
jgi:hypothetical protein